MGKIANEKWKKKIHNCGVQMMEKRGDAADKPLQMKLNST